MEIVEGKHVWVWAGVTDMHPISREDRVRRGDLFLLRINAEEIVGWYVRATRLPEDFHQADTAASCGEFPAGYILSGIET